MNFPTRKQDHPDHVTRTCSSTTWVLQDSKHGSVGRDWQLSIKLRKLYLIMDNCNFKKNIQQKLANLSMYCVKRTYAMHAASSERKCTWGFKMNVFMAVLLFFDSTATLAQRISQKTHHYWLWRKERHSTDQNLTFRHSTHNISFWRRVFPSNLPHW